MSGTKIGGKKASQTNKELYGENFYQEIGRKGGRAGHTGGFAANPDLASAAGAKGGRISKRGKGSYANKKLNPNKEKIQDMYDDGMSMVQIAKKMKVPAMSLRNWAKGNILGYGREWEE